MPSTLIYFLVTWLGIVGSHAEIHLPGDLFQRDDVFVPERVDIPIFYDEDGRYVASVILGMQTFELPLTMGTGLTYVAGSGCQGCQGVEMSVQPIGLTVSSGDWASNRSIFQRNDLRLTDQRKLLTSFDQWVDVGISEPNEFSQLSTSQLMWLMLATLSVVLISQESPNTLQVLSNAVVGSSISGIIGLGTNRGVSSNATQIYKPTFLDSIPGQWLDANPTAANFTFGMALSPPLINSRLVDSNVSVSLPLNKTAGILHWLQTDTSFYQQDQLSYANVDNSLAASVVTATDPRDWLFPLDGWSATTAGGSVGNQTQLIANVDLLHQGIYIPLRDAELMYASIPESYLLSTTSTFGALSQSWSVPCDAELTLGITVGLRTFTLDSSALVIPQPDGSCVGAIEGWKDPKVTQYLLGARFLSSLYVIFVVQPNGSSLIGFSIIAENIVISSSSRLGVIVGGTIGGLALLLLSVFIIWWCCIRPQSSTAYSPNLVERQRPTTFDIAPYPLMGSRFPNEPPCGAQKIAWNPGTTTSGSSSQATFASDRSDYTANLLRPPRSSPRAHCNHFCRNHHKAAIDRPPPPAYDDGGRRTGVVRKPLGK